MACCAKKSLTHWGRVTHICVSKLTTIGSDDGLSPGLRQAIIWTNAEILLTGHLGTKFSEILIEIHTFSFKKMHLKMSSGKWHPFCLGLNVLSHDVVYLCRKLPSLSKFLWFFYCPNLLVLNEKVICQSVIIVLAISLESKIFHITNIQDPNLVKVCPQLS